MLDPKKDQILADEILLTVELHIDMHTSYSECTVKSHTLWESLNLRLKTYPNSEPFDFTS